MESQLPGKVSYIRRWCLICKEVESYLPDKVSCPEVVESQLTDKVSCAEEVESQLLNEVS